MGRWVDLDACPCHKCLIKQDCIERYDGECSKYKAWKQGEDVVPVQRVKDTIRMLSDLYMLYDSWNIKINYKNFAIAALESLIEEENNEAH